MITFKEGDLLGNTCAVICHQVNCKGVMGSGIAKQIKEKYPSVYDDYKQCLREFGSISMFGRTLFTPIDDSWKHYVASMFSQYEYGRDGKVYTDYTALRLCLKQIRRKFMGQSIAIPYNLGCGRGGGNWNTVLQIIKEILGDCDVTIYKLGK